MSYGVKLKDISHEDLIRIADTPYIDTPCHESVTIWYGRTPDGKVWKITQTFDQSNGYPVHASVEFTHICEADPNCRSCAGYCSRAIPSEEDYVSGKINRF